MSELPTDLRYTKDHEWVRPSGDAWAVGITHFAVEQLGDITLVDLPAEGALITKGQRFGTIESVKSVSDLYAPLSGKVTRVNGALRDQPELINSDCYGDAWMVEVTPSDKGELDELMDSETYGAQIAG
jgi:glycine cleavage system H protein